MNIYLRQLYLTDINRIYEIKSNSLNYNKEFTSFDTSTVTIKSITEWFYNIINETDTIRFGIILLDNNYLIGLITLGKVNFIKSTCELNIAIEYKYQNKGIGKKSLLLLIDYIRNIIKLKEIFLKVHKNNIIAKNLYIKLGFKELYCENNFIYMLYVI